MFRRVQPPSLDADAAPRPPKRLRVFSVEPRAIQVDWSTLGPGPIRFRAADTTHEIVADGVTRPARKSDVIEIVDARMRELFEKIGEEMSENASAHRLPAGLVLTGGAAQLANAAEIAREVLEIPVRVASPEGVGGLTDHLLTPQYSTAIGLLLWAARVVTTEDLQRYEPPPRTQSWDRLREAVRQFFP